MAQTAAAAVGSAYLQQAWTKRTVVWPGSVGPIAMPTVVYSMEEMERPRRVKMIYAAGGDPLSTSHRGKGLYG